MCTLAERRILCQDDRLNDGPYTDQEGRVLYDLSDRQNNTLVSSFVTSNDLSTGLVEGTVYLAG